MPMRHLPLSLTELADVTLVFPANRQQKAHLPQEYAFQVGMPALRPACAKAIYARAHTLL